MAVVRFWIPLEPIGPAQHTMAFINGSHRTRDSDSLSATNFATTAAVNNSELEPRLLRWHAAPGDMIAFAGESVHNAVTRDCTRCLRLILGFAGERAVFDASVPSPLMPLGGGQVHRTPLHGPAFPKVRRAAC